MGIRTRAVHIDQSIRVPVKIWVVTSHNNGLGTQSLCLPRLVDKLAPSSLYERNPGVIRIWFVRACHADLRATQVTRSIRRLVHHETTFRRISAPTRIFNDLIYRNYQIRIRVIFFAGDGEGIERDDIAQERLFQVVAEAGGSGGEDDGRRSVDDGYAAVEAPPGEEDAAFGALSLRVGGVERETIADRGGVCQKGGRAGRGGRGEAKERGREGEGESPGQEEGEEEAGRGESCDHHIHYAADIGDGADIESRGTLLSP